MAASPTSLNAPLQTADAVANALQTDPVRGLSAQEAVRRLSQDGPNQLRTTPPPPAWRRLLKQFQDPLIYLLMAAVVVTLLAWVIEGRVGWPVDAVVIAVIVVLNGILGYVQEAKAADAAAALARMVEATSAVMRDGQLTRVPSATLVCGDLLVLSEGDAVGADARLVRAAALRVQEASLTGESEAVLKDAATLVAPAAVADQRNMVFKGTAVAQGTGLAIVTATGMATQMGAIAHLLAETRQDATPLQKEIRRVGQMLGLAVIMICVLVVGSVLLVTEVHTVASLVSVMMLGVSLAVAAVPEGLPAILSMVLAIGVQRMARRQAIVKHLSSVETLGSASVICTDKTGTLTRSEMTLQRGMTASGHTQVTGVGYAPTGEVQHQGQALTEGDVHSEHIALLSGGSLAGNADLRQTPTGEWEIQGDPTEAAFLVAEHKLGAQAQRDARFERISEVPFTSDRKMMSVLARDREQGNAPVLVCKGAPDVLLARCTHLRVGKAIEPLTPERRAQALAQVEELSQAALRTLAVAYRPIAADEDLQAGHALEEQLIFVGTAGIIDPPREEAGEAIAEARRAGIRVIMITGDHPRTAERIATDLGLVEPGARALTGIELDALDDAGWAEAVRTTSVFARVAPAHKLRIVDALQAQGQIVAMTGDGVNDAPALKAADIGIAMGITGTEVSKEAAKMILADDNFATIVDAVREGRAIFDNIRKFLRYLLSSNMGEVLTVFLGVVAAQWLGLLNDGQGVILPLLATQLLWVNLITDSGPALAMGMDPPTDDVMARPPRRLSERVIDLRMWLDVMLNGLVIAVCTLLTLDWHLPGGLIEGHDSLELARTAAFTVLVLAQLFNAFNARSDTHSAFHQACVNPWLWGAVGLSALLQIAVVHLPVLHVAFGTVPLSLDQWLFCLAMGSAVLWVSEMKKWVGRWTRPTH
ncbi:MAG: cation-translocating P-type ATPase [Aquabacterium sp.]|jgi:magnesium-transporting ATPase (P-type)|uniref:cation-translocating P-type ATPase n=1 Tax=Aquabacterium sp. TaxID=1872578 RepID=UPI002A36E075|nr:cation-translocating P-type ATPase [Aquabacterium sp.]MDX9842420.1 cation-translocating P-type ATPase [Aquabacterium sp.]